MLSLYTRQEKTTGFKPVVFVQGGVGRRQFNLPLFRPDSNMAMAAADIDTAIAHMTILLLSPVWGVLGSSGLSVPGCSGVVLPEAGISTAAFLYPQTWHSSCFEPFSSAVGSLSVTHLKVWEAALALSWQTVHSCQWLFSSDFRFFAVAVSQGGTDICPCICHITVVAYGGLCTVFGAGRIIV